MTKKEKKKLGRRAFLKLGGVGAAAVALGHVAQKVSAVQEAVTGTKRMAMVIDLRKCYGCHACSVSCKSENGVILGNFRSWVHQVNKGEYPFSKRFFLPRLCNHCKNSPCVKICPTGASYEREDGVVLVKKDICIGCRYCMSACPYGTRSFIWNRRKNEMPYPSRKFGVVDKCDFCVHRIDKGLVPACVNTCPAKARTVGDLNDHNSEVYRLVSTNPVQTLFPELGTQPHTYYIGLDRDVADIAMKSGVRMTPVELA